MRAMKLGNPAGLDRLELGSAEPSPIGGGQVRVRVHATSLNYHDYLVVTAFYERLRGAFRCAKAPARSSRSARE